MEITYLGHSSFKLKSKFATLVTDPFNSEFTGLKFPKTVSDIVTISHGHKDHNDLNLIEGTPLVVEGPGEYEVKGVKIIGIPSFHDETRGSQRGNNTIYRFKIDGISIVHLGDLGHKIDENTLEVLDGVDILLIPVGGFYTISSTIAIEVISKLEPKIVIPMHYKRKDLKYEIAANIAGVEVFLKEMGKENVVPVPKLLVTRDKLPAELTVIVLE